MTKSTERDYDLLDSLKARLDLWEMNVMQTDNFLLDVVQSKKNVLITHRILERDIPISARRI